MNRKTVVSYIIIVCLSFVLHATQSPNRIAFMLLPLLMFVLPLVFRHQVRIRFTPKYLLLGLVVSAVMLIPYSIAFQGNAEIITVELILFQFFGVALPEEFFFRGYLQDSLGRSIKAVAFISLLFAIAHLPSALFLGEWMSLLSFFPSLVMGWLYVKTNNILPGTIFHLFANLAQHAVQV